MLIPCPNCRANITAKAPKPGKYSPKCPKCGSQFQLIVPETPGATVLVKPMPTAKTTAPGREEAGSLAADPTEATGAYIPTDRGPAPEDTAEATGAYLPTPGSDDPTEATGAYVPKPAVEATAAYTESAEPAKPKGKRKKAAEPEMPQQLGGYEIEKQLGRGGMGAVYLARQLSLDRPVALKVMNPQWAEDPVFLARFVREAYAAAQLNHHNVVSIYDIGEDAGINFFSMEFVEGKSLGDILRRKGKLEPAAAVGYVLQAARGLKFAHDRGMVHRDVKPDNMMLNTEGLVKVADLGLVKTKGMTAADDRPPDESHSGAHSRSKIKSIASTEMTTAGSAMGSPSYMAPEQCKDAATVDQRADIYSLGCSLFALLAGRAPFQGDTAVDVMLKHVNEPPPPLRELVPDVPTDLDAIITKSLEKDPADRYQTMDEFIAALKGWQDSQGHGPPKPTEEQIRAFETLTAALAGEQYAKLVNTLGAVMPLAGASGGLLLLLLMPTVGATILLATATGVLSGFVLSGLVAGGPLFTKAREWVASARIADFATAGAAVLLFLLGVYLAGLTLPAVIAVVLGAGLGAGFAFGLVRMAAEEKRKLKGEMDGILKRLRLAGMDEDAVRQFVIQVAADDWELAYETLFGYPAKLAARSTLAEKGEARPKYAAWRDTLIDKLNAFIEARAAARAKRRLAKLEVKRLQAEGLSAAEAKAQAEDAAEDLVEQAAVIRKANVDRRTHVDVRRVLTRYEKAKLAQLNRPRRSPVQKLVRQIKRTVLAPQVRLLLGAALIVGGLMWVRQNEEVLLKSGSGDAKQQALGLATRLWKAGPDAADTALKTKPLDAPLPGGIADLFDSANPIIAGGLILMTAFSGSLATIVAVGLGSAIVLLGHKLELPIPGDIGGMMNPRQLTLVAGAALGLVGLILFRRR